MLSNRWLSFVLGLVLLCVVDVFAVDCESFKSCEECTGADDAQCVWATNLDCTQSCHSVPQGSGGGINTVARKWRREESKSPDECPNHNTCTFLEEPDLDGSFEEGKWTSIGYSNAANIIYDRDEVIRISQGDIDVFDGDKVAWFGRYNNVYSQELNLKVKIPPSATHLSIFILASFDPASRTVFTVLIDDDFVGYIDADRANSYLTMYRSYDINIKKYAGKKHTIRFLFYGTASTDHALLDYVSFISDPSLGDNDWHAGEAWKPTEDCATGCQVRFTTDERCDPLCDNVMCNFDNGACEGNQFIVQKAADSDGTRDICYSKQEARPVSEDLDICPYYTDTTCCIFDSEISYVKEKIDNSTKKCKVESKCQNALRAVYCLACSPRSAKYFEAGQLSLCESYSLELYDMCSGSEFYNATEGKCYSVARTFTRTTFPALFGTVSPEAEKCFNGVDVADDGVDLYLIIGISVGAVVLIVVIVIIIVAAVYHHKKKNAGPAVIDMASIDAANNMTLVPVDMLGNPNDGGVIYIDDAGGVADPTASVGAAPASVAPAPNAAPVAGAGGAMDLSSMDATQSGMMMMNPMMMSGTNLNMLAMSNGMMGMQMNPQMTMGMQPNMQMQMTQMQMQN